jgi:NADH:ubiquinone oxidoreductase subunit F (NADH-binding)
VKMDYEGILGRGTMLGSGGVIVFDDAQSWCGRSRASRASMRTRAARSARSAARARRGPRASSSASSRAGHARTSTPCFDLAEQHDRQDDLRAQRLVRAPVVSGLKKFRGEFEALIKDGRRPVHRGPSEVAMTDDR